MQCVRVSFLDSQFRQHSEGGGGDEDYFFSGFGDLQEYGESDGQHGSGRDYDYFEVRMIIRSNLREEFIFLTYQTLIILFIRHLGKAVQCFVWK